MYTLVECMRLLVVMLVGKQIQFRYLHQVWKLSAPIMLTTYYVVATQFQRQ